MKIQQTVVFAASPARVFEALMDEKQHAAFTGEPASIGREPGGRVSCYGGKVTGFNLDIVANERVVQAWRPGNFPPGVFTIATFVLEAVGDTTKLSFTQDAVPEAAHEHLAKGWHDRYWKPLAAYLEARPASRGG